MSETTWDVHERFNDGTMRIPIDEPLAPPCTGCAYWKPQRLFRESRDGAQFDGVRMCHADDQYHDFSCFQPAPDRPREP